MKSSILVRMMEPLLGDDLRKAMKFLTLTLGEDRILTVTSSLNELMRALQPLGKLHLPKELEPTSYLGQLRRLGR